MIDFSRVADYKVLVVGDGIIDEYIYVKPIGKSIKENIISTAYEGEERFKGGVWAGANHIRDFCKRVDVMTGPEIMVNTRYVDKRYMTKLFPLHRKQPNGGYDAIDYAQYDLVIVTDFGHGAVTRDVLLGIARTAGYIAVNCQTNSTNFGFNLITKIPRAELVVLDELEARLAVHDREKSE